MSISRATFCVKLFLIAWWPSFQSYINYYCNLFCCCWYFSYHLPSKHHKFLGIKDDIHNVFTEALPTVGIHPSIRWIKWALSTTELLFNIFMMFLKANFTKHLTYPLRKQDQDASRIISNSKHSCWMLRLKFNESVCTFVYVCLAIICEMTRSWPSSPSCLLLNPRGFKAKFHQRKIMYHKVTVPMITCHMLRATFTFMAQIS